MFRSALVFAFVLLLARNVLGSYTGDGTFYGTTNGEGGACLLDNPTLVSNYSVVAINNPKWETSANCGRCIKVKGAKGTTTVIVVNKCPECASGDLDLSTEAFALIDDTNKGRVSITWDYITCPSPWVTSGGLKLKFKEGSSAYWAAVQVRNHKIGISGVAYKKSDGTYASLVRQDYNYFLASSGMGSGPYTFKITGIDGTSVITKSISLTLDTVLSAGVTL